MEYIISRIYLSTYIFKYIYISICIYIHTRFQDKRQPYFYIFLGSPTFRENHQTPNIHGVYAALGALQDQEAVVIQIHPALPEQLDHLETVSVNSVE